VSSGVPLARRPAALASKPSADEMVVCQKAFEILMSLSYIAHTLSPLPLMKYPLRFEQLERFGLFEPFKKFKPVKSFKPFSDDHTSPIQ
jgi:hypothetical protein